MDVIELYATLGEDYNEVIGRIGKDERIAKYLKKLLSDNSGEDLLKAIDEQDWELVFKAAHSIKGIGLNLGLSRLAEKASALCEVVRGGELKAEPSEIKLMSTGVDAEYSRVIDVVKQLD